MLRTAVDANEQAFACGRLKEARQLMIRALTLIDGTPVATDCDAHLDHAIHNISEAIADAEAGAAIFTDKEEVRGQPAASDERPAVDVSASNPWS